MATTETDPKPAGAADSEIKSAGKTYEGLSREQLVEAYRIMYTSRRLDDREIMLKRQQKIFFQISGAGHEAVGVAAGYYRQFKDVVFHGDEVTYVSLGDGTTSEGEFWEALNTASNRRLPMVFVVEDNGYAISVPVEVQTAGGNISRLVAGFPYFHFEEVDGTDPVAAYAAFVRSVAHCRAGDGPAFIHPHVIPPYSHSLSDDERLYRPDAERQRDAQRDPISLRVALAL